MSSLEEELRLDAAEDARAIAYIRQQLPERLLSVCTEEYLQEVIDILVDCLAESDALEADADDEGYVEINIDILTASVAERMANAGLPLLSSDDLQCVTEAWLDFDTASFENRQNA